jgi:hypothetical protein
VTDTSEDQDLEKAFLTFVLTGRPHVFYAGALVATALVELGDDPSIHTEWHLGKPSVDRLLSESRPPEVIERGRNIVRASAELAEWFPDDPADRMVFPQGTRLAKQLVGATLEWAPIATDVWWLVAGLPVDVEPFTSFTAALHDAPDILSAFRAATRPPGG